MDRFPAHGQEGPPTVTSSTRLWPAVIGGGVLALVFGVAVGLLLVRWSHESAKPSVDGESSRTVQLEPVTYRSDAPFTESVVSISDEELRAASSALVGTGGNEQLSGRVSGDTSRLYGSRRSAPPCDVARLVELLNADDATLSAWAGVVGVAPADVPALVQTLTPVLLGADTAVTNHTYGSDGAESLQSVLEAGTPVLIDDRGAPRVQCSCGNPLLPPDQPDEPAFVGEQWESFDAARTVEVVSADTPTPELVTIDTDTSEEVEMSLGGTLSLDGVLVTTDSSVMAVDDSGKATTVIDRPVDTVFDDGAGGLVYTLARSDLGVDEYDDHPPVDPAEGAIWHLAAGATEAVSLTDLSDTATWHELLAVGQLGGDTYVVYTPLHVEHHPDAYPGDVAEGPVVVREQSTGQVKTLIEQAVGWEAGVSVASIGGDRLAIALSAEAVFGWTVFDSSLTEVPNACETSELDDDDECVSDAVLNENGQLVTTESAMSGTTNDVAIALDPRSFAEVKRWPLGYSSVDNRTRMSQARGGFITMTFDYSFDDGSGTDGALADLATGELRDFSSVADGQIFSVWILEAPLVRPLTHSDATSDSSADRDDHPSVDPASVLVDGVPNDCRIRNLMFYNEELQDLVGINPNPADDVSGQTHSTIAPDATILLSGTDGFEEATLVDLTRFLDENAPSTFLLCGSPEGWRWIEPAPKASPITSESELNSHGIGEARAGMRFEEVEVAIGGPLHLSDDLETGGECVWVTFPTGSEVEGLGGLGGDGVLGRVDVDGGPWKTTEGIGIGATEEQVRAAYPKGLTEEVHPYDEFGKYLKYRDVDDAGAMIIFEVNDGRVAAFRAGETDWVELVEGCA